MRDRFLSPFLRRRPRVTILRLQGVIAGNGMRGALNHASLAPVIERAFRRGRPRAVALVINSPGGSPVQSSLVAAHVRRLADELRMPTHAFVEDVAASGGYWLATAADDIWLDDSSITGSIGVISASFGFADLLARHGVERRVHTAGEDKSMLDPFRPERDEDVTRLKQIQSRIHETFIDQVRKRRGERLDAARDLFSGEIFVGADAVAAGLADGIGHAVPKLREIYGPDIKARTVGIRRPLLQRLMPGVMAAAAGAVEDRAAWSRFGL